MHDLKYLTLKRLVKLSKIGHISRLQEQLSELACPERLRIGLRTYHVPISTDQLRDNICWGQRLMMNNRHETDFESMMFFVSNYYQPIVTKQEFSEERVIEFYRRLTTCHAHEIYPVLIRIVTFFEQMVETEIARLNSEPDKKMKAAEVSRLKPFTDLNILELISSKTGVKLHDAHLVDYNTVFALLWQEKETIEFRKRYDEILIAASKSKTK